MSKTPISKAGWLALKAELDQLIEVERPRVVDEVAFAAAQGDRSENAEYIYGKKRLREIDHRWRYLSKRLESVAVVDTLPDQVDEVRFGATVKLVAGPKAMTATIVGEDEIDPAQGRISLKSPLAKALIGKKKGEIAEVATPRGVVAWTIEDVSY
ncbi:MAG TPA: transcription elongation factor GreB [Fibrobacteria bacterium]|nr:transcription elongation factor GreB [Fibrobacteria bacterium]